MLNYAPTPFRSNVGACELLILIVCSHANYDAHAKVNLRNVLSCFAGFWVRWQVLSCTIRDAVQCISRSWVWLLLTAIVTPILVDLLTTSRHDHYVMCERVRWFKFLIYAYARTACVCICWTRFTSEHISQIDFILSLSVVTLCTRTWRTRTEP